MQHEVQRAPFALQALEHRFQFAFVQQVQRHQHVGPHLLGQRLDVGQGLVVQVGHGQFGAHGVKGLGAAPGDGVGIGDAGDQAALAGQR